MNINYSTSTLMIFLMIYTIITKNIYIFFILLHTYSIISYIYDISPSRYHHPNISSYKLSKKDIFKLKN